MASAPALRVADIVDEILSITNKTNSSASITLAANGDGSFNFQVVTMDQSEQFGGLQGVENYLAALNVVIGSETNKDVANANVRTVRQRRRLEQRAASIAAELAALENK
jgi:hypothetical protein